MVPSSLVSLDCRNSERGSLGLPPAGRKPGRPGCVDRRAEQDQVLEDEPPGVAPGCEDARRREQEGERGEERGRGDESGDGAESWEPGSGRDSQSSRELDHSDQRGAPSDTEHCGHPCQEGRVREQGLDGLRLEPEELERSEEEKEEGEAVAKDACAEGLKSLATPEVEEGR